VQEREERVDDRGRIAIGIGIGALLGGIVGYLFLTERGREVRENLEPRLNDLLGEVDSLRTTFERTRAAVTEGLQSFHQLLNEPSPSQTGSQAWNRPPSTGSGQTH
jgi:hypothetical protein